MAYTPRDYQARAIADTLDLWTWHKYLLGVAATGAGKTDIGLWIVEHLIRKYGSKVLVLVHTRDLVDQWEQRIYKHHRDVMPIGVIQGERHWTRGNLVIATFQSLARLGRLYDLVRREQVDVVVVDETHRVLSPTYLAILRSLQRRNPNVRVLGLTATPNRTDGQPLSEVYEKVAFNVGIDFLVASGYLAPSRQVDIPIPASLDQVRIRGGDYEPAGVAAALNKSYLNELFFERWRALASDRPTVVFTSTVQHAKDVAELFQRNGVVAAHISGTTTDSEQAVWDQNGIQAAFNRGKVQVVTNARKWIEGVDIPRCSCIGYLSPTTSRLVFQQATGRGMRPYPGKVDNLILRAMPVARQGLVGLADIGYAANPLGTALPMPVPERQRIEYERKYRTKFERLWPDEAWR